MTNLEAKRILDEIRTVCPRFIEGRQMFIVRQDGRVGVWDAVGKSGLRWASGATVAGDTWWLPARVRERAAEEGGSR
jgi:hypothetical protein